MVPPDVGVGAHWGAHVGGTPHACSCAEGTGFADGGHGGEWAAARVRRGVHIHGATALPRAVCLSDMHARVPGTCGSERAQRGAP